jgi:DNA-binding LacI/PurR family transcriptional regulator
MTRHNITITDLARELNISPSTVSRALSNHPAISDETRKAVTELARRLNYKPNLQALNLLKKKTNTIGVVIPDITSYFYSSIITGIQDFFSPLGYNLILGQSNESYEEELKIIHTFASVRVDGILIAPASNTTNVSHLRELAESRIPLVIFDRDCEEINVDKVFVNEYSGAFQAVDYLIRSGCSKIAHLGGATTISTSRHRMQGYLDALKKNSIPVRDEFVIICDGFTPDDGAKAVKKLLSRDDIPDAVFAVSDSVAIGVMHAIKEAGISIPEQISVVGFDDILYSSWFKPSLTTVWQPVYEMGLLSARILAKRIDESEENFKPRIETLFPELVIRGSSRPPGTNEPLRI